MANLSSFYPQPVLEAGSGITVEGTPTFRTLSDRFGEVFHVDDYGAVGDWNGTTGTDDTAAIQAAINAAVANNGGVIRFGAGKKYRLNTSTERYDTIGYKYNVCQLRVGSGNLTSNFGSTSMQLVFDGNGATLHSTNYPNGGNTLLYVCCQFGSIILKNLNFVRSRYFMTGLGAQATAVLFAAADTNQHDHIIFERCTFNNCFSSIVFVARELNIESIRGKLKRVDVIDCVFDHPYGSGREAGYSLTLAGALVVSMDSWTDVANFRNCQADGINGGTLPSENYDAMHGFLFPMPQKAFFENCYFKHMTVETIKASDTETGFARIGVDGFTQPSVGDTMTREITRNDWNVQTLTVGNVYSFADSRFASGRIGFYRLEPNPAGGSYSFAIGTTLLFRRLSSDIYNLPSSRDFAATDTPNVNLIDVTYVEKCSLQINNCFFDGSEQVEYTNPSNQLSQAVWPFPHVLIDYTGLISNSIFVGGVWSIYTTGAPSTSHKPLIINGNSFYTYNPNALQSETNAEPFIEIKKNATITNNSFVAEKSRALKGFVLGFGGNDIIVKNNNVAVLDPSSFGSGGVDQRGIAFIIERNGGPYRIFAEDNYLKNLEHYVFANHATVGHFVGTLRSTVLATGSSGSVRIAKRNTSPDGSQWTIGVTNDGELEVIK